MNPETPPKTIGDWKKAYLQLPAPKEIPSGKFRAEWVGPDWFQSFAKQGLNVMSFRNWWGKSFDNTPVAYNLFQDPKTNEFETKYAMKTYLGNSRFDGKPCLYLEYGKEAPFPWPYFLDEFRVYSDGVLLGLNYSRFSPFIALPFLVKKV